MKHILLFLSAWLVLGFMSEANAQNLLVNGSFEEDRGTTPLVVGADLGGNLTDNWFLVVKPSSEGTAQIGEDQVISGSKSMHVNLTAIDARYRFFMAQEIRDVVPGKYTYSVWLKSDKAGEPFRMDAIAQTENSSTGTDLKTQAFTTTTGWVRYDMQVDLSARTENVSILRLVIRFNCNLSGNVVTANLPVNYWVDDTSFGVKKITNGDFESSVAETSILATSDAGGSLIDTWKLIVKPASTGSGVVVDGADAYAGLKSLKVDLTNIDYRYRFFLAQEVTNLAPKKYKLSVSLKADKANIPFRIDFLDIASGATNGGTEISKHPFVTTTDWTQYDCELDLSANSEPVAITRIAIRFNCFNGGSVQNEPVTYWLDNITLEENATSSIGDQLSNQKSVTVYSTGNTIHFQGLEEKAKVSLYNTTGVLVLTDTVLPGSSIEVNRPGCYLVRVQEGNEVKTYKLMVAAQ